MIRWNLNDSEISMCTDVLGWISLVSESILRSWMRPVWRSYKLRMIWFARWRTQLKSNSYLWAHKLMIMHGFLKLSSSRFAFPYGPDTTSSQIYHDCNAWESNSEKLLEQHLGSYYHHGLSILWQGFPRLNESDVHLGWWCHEQDLASLLSIVSSWCSLWVFNFCGRVCWDWTNLLYSFDAVKKTLILFYLLSVQLQMCMLKKLVWIHLQFLLMRTTSFLVLLKVTMAQHGTFYLPLTFGLFRVSSSLPV